MTYSVASHHWHSDDTKAFSYKQCRSW